eukprot:gnl/TRDRNA2_/TRDRNA2_186085_c0_seq1.p1 gnl/TRDRNA2_/TRDRNA2_186085_c0~~gnl/TRDRNA2_/TRDRNA2_186085_c0_seq1.p1  ORF type:complete len:205 (+),score=36.29 gnl/TRDRNA2_/TRDRNA2_186085_c0_seq1:50-664(+)
MGCPAEGTDDARTMSMDWLSRLLPRENIRVEPCAVVHEGWVWKRSRHLKLWRKRWMMLTVDMELLTFEDSSQRGGATERFFLNGVRPAEVRSDGLLELEARYVSKRNEMVRNLHLERFSDLDPLRSTHLLIDAGPQHNRAWCQALRTRGRNRHGSDAFQSTHQEEEEEEPRAEEFPTEQEARHLSGLPMAVVQAQRAEAAAEYE